MGALLIILVVYDESRMEQAAEEKREEKEECEELRRDKPFHMRRLCLILTFISNHDDDIYVALLMNKLL